LLSIPRRHLVLEEVEMAESKESKEPPRTEHGHLISEAVSAYQKLLRRGDLDGALYFGLLVYRKAPAYIWRRTLIAVVEDVGFGSVETVMRVGILHSMWAGAARDSWSTSPHHLTLAIMLICAAGVPKDSSVEDCQTLAIEKIKDGQVRPIPPFALDAHTKAGKAAGATWRAWYADRLAAGMPVNPFLEELWRLRPEWAPGRGQDDLLPHEPGESSA
jgi:replication-associated recombination protein RarA